MPNLTISGITACVFDAYGTLFDVSGITHDAQDVPEEKRRALSDLWRAKQLQYTWLRNSTGQHADFWQVTGDALDFAMEALAIRDPRLRDHLMNRYLDIPAYPEVVDCLRQLKARGLKLAILSNGTPEMLSAVVARANLNGIFDAILSVEEVGIFKPHPAVYQLALDRLNLPPEAICFVSANGWDAFPAKAFGFQVLWCNRSGQAPEKIPQTPDGEIHDLSGLPEILFVAP